VPVAPPPWSISADGILLTVRLTPKGGRDAIEGIRQLADGRSVLAARVRAPASEGEANSALTDLVARVLGVARGDIAVVGGTTSRLKRLRIRGDAGAILAALARLGGDGR
jgi:uncharacterized protein (TIGR00251 family)